MFRLLGFIAGAALAIGAIVMVLGRPALRESSAETLAEATLRLPNAMAEVTTLNGPETDSFPSTDRFDSMQVEIEADANVETPANANTVTESAAGVEPRPGLMSGAVSMSKSESASSIAGTANWPADTELPADAANLADDFAYATPAATDSLPTDDTTQTNAWATSTAAAANTASLPPDPAMPNSDPLWQSIWNPFRSEIAANGFAARLTAITGIDYRVVRLKPGVYQVAFAYSDDSERTTKLAQIQAETGLDLQEAAL